MPRPPVVTTVTDLRAAVSSWRKTGERIGLVPTMGALHDGHLSLVDLCRKHGARAIVSIFVNPAQFAPTEDFNAYPRGLDRDLDALSDRADLVFAPAVAEIYPQGFVTTIRLDGPATAGLEDAARPDHFAGVATVVAKLLIQAAPDIAIFGEKDFQQLAVIRRMTRDLDLPVEIVGGPTVREADGLAMSSRNVYLGADDRAIAPTIHAVLQDCAAALRAGTPPDTALEAGRARLAEAGFEVDYLDLRDAASLERPAPGQDGPCRLLVAARLGSTRLIDNIAV